MDLSSLIIPSKTISEEYPGYKGFVVDLAYLTKDEVVKIRKAATKHRPGKRGALAEDYDSDLFQDLYIKAIVKGWTGLRVSYVAEWLPLDLSILPGYTTMAKEKQDEVVLEYTPKDALDLMKNVPDFDEWVTEVLGDVSNFTTGK